MQPLTNEDWATPEAQHQAYLKRTRPYETYQVILKIFTMNSRCRPADVCRDRCLQVACYHPETKEFAIYQRDEFEETKNQGWKALRDPLNYGVRPSFGEQYLYELKSEDIPAYPYDKRPGASPY